MSSPSQDSTPDYDPTFINTRREAIIIVLIWAACLAWCVPYCYLYGYNLPADELQTFWGFPTWVFWGILLPWVLASLFGIAFSLFWMTDDDLGEVDESVASSDPSKLSTE